MPCTSRPGVRFHSVHGTMGILGHIWGPNWCNMNGHSIGIKTDPSPYILKNSTSSIEQSLLEKTPKDFVTHPQANY